MYRQLHHSPARMFIMVYTCWFFLKEKTTRLCYYWQTRITYEWLYYNMLFIIDLYNKKLSPPSFFPRSSFLIYHSRWVASLVTFSLIQVKIRLYLMMRTWTNLSNTSAIVALVLHQHTFLPVVARVNALYALHLLKVHANTAEKM